MSNEIYHDFNSRGYVVLPGAIDEDLIDEYLDLWSRFNVDRPEGWSKLKTFTRSFNEYYEIRNILCSKSIHDFFTHIGHDPVLHADITYAVSTQLNWHQDNTSSSDGSIDTYYGSWVALEDISPKSGPLCVVPGSHIWDMDYNIIDPVNCNEKEDSAFKARRLEYYLEEIEIRNVPEFSFTANKGDILIWHGRLLHRGSVPHDYSMSRMSLIGHYSKYSGPVSRHKNGCLYALN